MTENKSGRTKQRVSDIGSKVPVATKLNNFVVVTSKYIVRSMSI